MRSPATQFSATSLFSPLQLGDLTLPNRLVMPRSPVTVRVQGMFQGR